MSIAKATRSILTALVLIAALFGAQQARGQTQSFEERAAQLERKIEALRLELRELRGEPKSAAAQASQITGASQADIDRIRDEGLNRSQVMPTLSYLTDVIGPRLTASPNLKRANEWSRDKLTSWGLVNAHLEPWGPFGRGWSLKQFSIHVVEPQTIPLVACPKAWTPGFDKPLVAEVKYLDAKTEADLEKYQGTLKGAIVLVGAPRPVKINFEPYGRRMSDDDLRIFAESKGGRVRPAAAPTARSPGAERAAQQPRDNPRREEQPPEPQAAPDRDAVRDPPAPSSPDRSGRSQSLFNRRLLSFLVKEEAELLVTPSPQGDGGTIFVAGASVPGVEGRSGGRMRAWSPDAPASPPQIALAIEDYNRLVRMIGLGEKVKLAVDLQVQFHADDQMGYNTIAEIPGGDLKDEIVMLGAHLDSWHSGTGATDNGAGVAVVMEAVRILQALNLKPRRTVRIALWTGEEQGLLGSKAYVREHFGHYPEESAGGERRGDTSAQPGGARQQRTLVRGPEYDKFAGYFNLDNGSGRVRGIYAQDNAAVWPIFRRWMAPFRDMGAETVTLASTGGTDHLSFDAIGLPGFQFIQDPIEYMTLTHHSNADVYDRVQADDLKQASVIMAAFVYHTAMADQKLPHKAAGSGIASTTPSGAPAGTPPR
jgi:hypothetical protein